MFACKFSNRRIQKIHCWPKGVNCCPSLPSIYYSHGTHYNLKLGSQRLISSTWSLPTPTFIAGDRKAESLSAVFTLTSACFLAPKHLHLTLEQHGFELHEFIDTWFFFQYCRPFISMGFESAGSQSKPAVGMQTYCFKSTVGWTGGCIGLTGESKVIHTSSASWGSGAPNAEPVH